jgi:hypothetical protein
MAPKRKKKDADLVEAPSHGELLSIIEQTQDLPMQHKLQLMHCGQGACPPGCKGGRKDNPACLCGLAPEEGHFKKTGLFQKTPAVLSELGVDPGTQRRAVRAVRSPRASDARFARPAGS